MTKDHGKQIKNDEQYEALRDEDMSKEKAAWFANTDDAGEKGGENKKYEKRTKKELDQKAKEIGGIKNYSKMTKDELIDELRNQ